MRSVKSNTSPSTSELPRARRRRPCYALGPSAARLKLISDERVDATRRRGCLSLTAPFMAHRSKAMPLETPCAQGPQLSPAQFLPSARAPQGEEGWTRQMKLPLLDLDEIIVIEPRMKLPSSSPDSGAHFLSFRSCRASFGGPRSTK